MRSKRRLAIVGAAVIAISGAGIGAATSAGVVFAGPTPAVYTACVAHATGALYGVTANGTPTCQAQDTIITWDQQGPAGPQGAAGPRGPAGPAGPAQLESWSSCTGTLCIDAPPEGPSGFDGSGGWGWDNVTNSPVSALTVGTPASFTVTVLQPSTTTPACGSSSGTITLSYSSQDFSLSSKDSHSTPVISTTPFDRGGVQVWTYTGDFWCHGDQSVAYTFTPQNPTAEALVTATVQVDGQQASETFPVAIQAS